MIRSTSQLAARLIAGRTPRLLRTTALAAAAWLCLAAPAFAQNPSTVSPSPSAAEAAQAPANDTLAGIAAQIRELRLTLEAMREQLAGSRREADELRRELQTVRDQLAARQAAPDHAADEPPGATPGPGRIDAIAEEQDLLHAKVEDLEQTKIESGSKYHVRLSGLMLLNVQGTRGAVDNLDLPVVALPRTQADSGGSLSADARQSRFALDMFGPTLAGAKTTGEVAVDFFGGFPGTHDGVSAPRVRLRTATFALDWKRTSVVLGQEAPFFSPRSPTSLVSTAYPSLSGAGNIWAWTMQAHVDHRVALSNGSTMVIQWGILDPLTGELPASEYDRVTTAGERSGLPAQAIRVGWQRGTDDNLAAFGAGAYHARQDWGFGRTVAAWAETADWDVPLGHGIALSGEVYRGRAIGGLGGGASESVLFEGAPFSPVSAVRRVESAGGWIQLKVKPAGRLDVNTAIGEDRPVRTGMSRLQSMTGVDGSAVNRNASGFVNAIYQARSNLLFSVEYRRLWTTSVDDVTRTAGHVSFCAGIVF